MEQRIEEFEYEEMAARGSYLPAANPVEANRPRRPPLFYDELTQEQIDAAIKEAMDEIEAGNVIPWEEVEAELIRDYGIKL